MPIDIDLQHLDDGGGIFETFMSQKACWHVSCFGKLNKQKVNRAMKRRLNENTECDCSPIKTRKKYDARQHDKCIFCDQQCEDNETLHRAQTLMINTKVKQCATDLEDTKILAKLSEGDMVALDAVYHTKCLAALYNRHTIV